MPLVQIDELYIDEPLLPAILENDEIFEAEVIDEGSVVARDDDTDLMERLFRAEVLRLLVGKGLISQDVVDNLLSWHHSGFSVHGEVKVPDREAAAEPFRQRARLTWAALIKKMFEIDPLLCPYCGAEMKIIAFITEHR